MQIDGKKLLLNQDVKVLKLLYLLPDSSSEIWALLGWCGDAYRITAVLVVLLPQRCWVSSSAVWSTVDKGMEIYFKGKMLAEIRGLREVSRVVAANLCGWRARNTAVVGWWWMNGILIVGDEGPFASVFWWGSCCRWCGTQISSNQIIKVVDEFWPFYQAEPLHHLGFLPLPILHSTRLTIILLALNCPLKHIEIHSSKPTNARQHPWTCKIIIWFQISL